MTMDRMPAPQPEPYLTRQQLAEHLAVSVDTVDKLVKAGMPSQDWGLRVRRFLLSEVLAWLHERERRSD